MLANLAGFGAGSNSNGLSKDKINGRIFIENIDAKLNFQSDPFFNTYDPNSSKTTDPIWKSFIKNLIGWKKISPDADEMVWQNIVKKYSDNVIIDETDNGSIKLVVTHVNPQRAAEIANVIMDEVISDDVNRKNTEQDEQLSYLSSTLAESLSELELSQAKLKEFALKNSALPLENFTAGSLQLDALREQLTRTTELLDAVAAVSFLLQNKLTDQSNYLELRQQFPIVDQVEFRRVLGQNEIISSWSWPKAKSVSTVFSTLSERKKRLQSEINASQIDAERSGLALENYAKLEREAKIAEATYTVLIERVKAQSMISGFRPNKTEIYEFASVSINPSAPRRSLILAIGAMSGLFFGTILSLILAHFRGVYYTKISLKTAAQARLTGSIRDLIPMRKKSLDDVNALLVKKPRSILRDMAVGIHKSAARQIVVSSSRTKLTGMDTARAIACYMQSDNIKIAIIDFSSKPKKLHTDDEKSSVGSFKVIESTDHISILTPNSDTAAIELLSQRGFLKKAHSLNSTFDLVFLCADNSDAISLLGALEGQNMFHITLARTRKTKSTNLVHIRSLLPIQGLLYD
jgi:capsular polysaccharide biosynthesis protein